MYHWQVIEEVTLIFMEVLQLSSFIRQLKNFVAKNTVKIAMSVLNGRKNERKRV